jgi:protein O-mannosyl-transferase
MYLSRNRTLTIALSAGLICLLLYLRALSCDFVNFDDPDYVIENPAIRILDWEFITSAFSTSYMGWWMPLTWISLAVDYHFWGLNPLGFHLTNILLHAINTALVVLIADRLLKPLTGIEVWENETGRFSYPATLLLAGLLWGIHPLRVESVAWVTERKDVLNGILSLGSILCYLHYAHKKESVEHVNGAGRYYILSLVLLLLSLMAKPVSVVLPAMFLVADWYPLGRLRKGRIFAVMAEKIPFLVLCASLAIATVYFASDATILVSFQDFPLVKRFILAGNALFEYCRLSIYPVGIIHLYLLPRIFPVSYYLAMAVTITFTCFCFYNCKKRPWLFATWLAFILPLVPVLGFLQNGAQAYAARFTYLPSVAPSITAAAIIAATFRKTAALPARFTQKIFIGLIAALLLFHGVMTEKLIGAWKNSETLWSRSIDIQPLGRAFYYRADYYMRTGNFISAAEDLSVSIRMAKEAGYPGLFNLHALRGDAFSKAGRYEDAVKEFTSAVQLNPLPNYFYHRGAALKSIGSLKEAEYDFNRAGLDNGPIKWQPFQ